MRNANPEAGSLSFRIELKVTGHEGEVSRLVTVTPTHEQIKAEARGLLRKVKLEKKGTTGNEQPKSNDVDGLFAIQVNGPDSFSEFREGVEIDDASFQQIEVLAQRGYAELVAFENSLTSFEESGQVTVLAQMIIDDPSLASTLNGLTVERTANFKERGNRMAFVMPVTFDDFDRIIREQVARGRELNPFGGMDDMDPFGSLDAMDPLGTPMGGTNPFGRPFSRSRLPLFLRSPQLSPTLDGFMKRSMGLEDGTFVFRISDKNPVWDSPFADTVQALLKPRVIAAVKATVHKITAQQHAQLASSITAIERLKQLMVDMANGLTGDMQVSQRKLEAKLTALAEAGFEVPALPAPPTETASEEPTESAEAREPDPATV